VQIGQGVAEIWPFLDFQEGGRLPSRIFYTSDISAICWDAPTGAIGLTFVMLGPGLQKNRTTNLEKN